jgi:hypothetical protein
MITSLQGKRLDQLYGKPNDFHASRRSWYLPIAPTPDHPDALSKKTKKRFPTLELANQETLRWDSYVNIRHVYKIDVSFLRPYTNPENPDAEALRFERESVIRMLAKGKSLTLYEPGPQFASWGIKRSTSDPTRLPTMIKPRKEEDMYGLQTLMPLAATVVPTKPEVVRDLVRVDFLGAATDADRIAGLPPKAPPDGNTTSVFGSFVQQSVLQPVETLIGEVQSLTMVSQRRLVALSRGFNGSRYPPNQLWRDMKGVAAVAIASI